MIIRIFSAGRIRQLSAALREGSLSAGDLLDRYLERIQRLNLHLNAFVYVDFDGAAAAANASTHGVEQVVA